MKYLLLISVVLLCSCQTSNLPVSTHSESTDHVNYVYIHDTATNIKIHTVYMKDSMAMRISGDTVFVDRWHTYKEKSLNENTIRSLQSKIDSLSAIQTDTIYVPAPKSTDVRELTSWQSFQIWVGRLVLIGVLLYAIFLYLKRKVSLFSRL